MREIGLSMLMMVATAACGGGTTAGAPPPRTGGGPCAGGMSARGGGGDEVCSPETLEAAQRFFKGHVSSVTACFTQALRDGKVSRTATGRVVAAMTIDAMGRPTEVHIADDPFKAPDMETCIVNLISSWSTPKPDVPFHFSFSYEFHAE